MKVIGFLAATMAMLAATAVAQNPCFDRCNEAERNCLLNGGTDVYCKAIRGMCNVPRLLVPHAVAISVHGVKTWLES